MTDSPHTTLRELISGFRVTQLLYVAAELRIADLLTEGPKSADELAAASGAHALSLFRVLRALASVGIFEQVDEQTFGLNEMAEPLVSSTPNSLRPLTLMLGTQQYPAWGNVLHTVRTGETAFDALYGMTDWDYRSKNEQAGQIFSTAMSVTGNWPLERIAALVDWSPFATIVDVGGGQGTLLAAILTRAPQARGILYDLEGPIKSANTVFSDAGLAGRIERVVGSFLERVPQGGDAYILSRILHDWQDDAAALILRNCKSAMRTGGHLIVIERILDATHPTVDAAFSDLNMMVMNGGRERTEREFQSLFKESGFRLETAIKTPLPAQILVAVAS